MNFKVVFVCVCEYNAKNLKIEKKKKQFANDRLDETNEFISNSFLKIFSTSIWRNNNNNLKEINKEFYLFFFFALNIEN